MRRTYLKNLMQPSNTTRRLKINLNLNFSSFYTLFLSYQLKCHVRKLRITDIEITKFNHNRTKPLFCFCRPIYNPKKTCCTTTKCKSQEPNMKYPKKTNRYDTTFVAKHLMGPNCLIMLEELTINHHRIRSQQMHEFYLYRC